MSKSSQQFDATKHFDEKRANVYESKIRRIVPGYEVMHDLSLNLLHHALPVSADILVVGAGTGQEALTYAGAHSSWRITGVDPTEKMLAVARERVQKQGLADRISLHLGKVEELPDTPCFDAATSILVMQFLPDNGAKKEFLAQISRRLKPGGRFIVIDLVGDPASQQFAMLLSAWESRQRFTGEDAEEVDKDFAHIRRDLQFITEERMAALLQEAGFGTVNKFFQSYLFSGWIGER